VKSLDYHELVTSSYYPLVIALLLFTVCYQLIVIRRVIRANKNYKNEFVQMKLNDERYVLAIEGSGDGIWDWNLASHGMYFSQQYKKLLGYLDDELSNTYEGFLALLHPEDKNKFLDAVNNHFEKGDVYDVELRLKNKSGAYVWFRSKGQAVFDNEHAVRMSGSLSDISALSK
jgi:PAS domain S-box-containing protein